MQDFEINDRRFEKYILANAPLEQLATGFRWTEGPVWMGDADCLLFQDIPRNRTMRWSESTGVSIYRYPSDYANGQTRDTEGRLITCSHYGRCLYRTEYDGRLTTLVTHYEGKRLNSPNDVIVKSDGSIWFSDPLYGISNDYEGGRQNSELKAGLYRFDPATNDLTLVADDFDGPNGLGFSPDERRLYVSETGGQNQENPRQYIRAFDLSTDGRRLSGGDIFHKIAPGFCDGLRVDEDGNVWASAGDGVHCIHQTGKLLGKILVGHVVSNLTFGWLYKNRLFITASQHLYSIFLNCRGVQWP